jgi:hypothetical protein
MTVVNMKLTKKNYLITVMIIRTYIYIYIYIYIYGQDLDTEIAGYDSPDYRGYTSSPTRMQVLRCYF